MGKKNKTARKEDKIILIMRSSLQLSMKAPWDSSRVKNYYSYKGCCGCKGKCKDYPGYKPTASMKGKTLNDCYSNGFVRCGKCESLFQKFPDPKLDRGFCPCCGYHVASRPSCNKARRKYNDARGIKRIE